MNLEKSLHDFASKHKFLKSKGALSVALVMTRTAQVNGLPLDKKELVTEGRGQVKGLGGEAVQKILAEHGITRLLAREGGRTSRGSMGNMQDYVFLLNDLQQRGEADLKQIELWWIQCVKNYFAAFPLKLKLDAGASLRASIDSLFHEAEKRQVESTGTMVVGAMMQHLVGAKLEVLYPEMELKHHGFSVADAPTQRPGDFILNGCAIHVTTTPTERLLEKCRENIDQGLSVLIITSPKGIVSVENLVESSPLAGRIDALDIRQFLVGNVMEWAKFSVVDRRDVIGQLLIKYNEIIEACETDPSLKIEFA